MMITPAQPLRVLQVTGVEVENYFTNNLVDYTDRREVEFLAVTFAARGSFVEQLEKRGVKSFALDCQARHRYPGAARRLREIVEAEQVGIIHAHLFEPALVASAVARLTGCALIVTRHHSDAVYRIEQPLKRKALLSLEHWINRTADHIIAPSLMVRDILLGRERVPARKVSLIPYGQTKGRFEAVTPGQIAAVRQELRMDGRLALACVARLHPEKGHRYLLEAFAQLVRDGLDATLYMVGQGMLREPLEQQARASGLSDRVRFLGWRDDALAVIAAADVIVHPSLQEALPSAVIEAVMLARPLVVTEISGARDIVGDNEYGLIVPPADAGALGKALAQVIEDQHAAKERAMRGREFLSKYMDAGRVAREHEACYRRIAQQRGLLRGLKEAA
jgi:glycosyltransferase involved in cell wall biosynthesis